MAYDEQTPGQERLATLLNDLEYVEAVGQFHQGAMYDEVTVYLKEMTYIDVRQFGGDGYYSILAVNPMEPCIELEIRRFPSE